MDIFVRRLIFIEISVKISQYYVGKKWYTSIFIYVLSKYENFSRNVNFLSLYKSDIVKTRLLLNIKNNLKWHKFIFRMT